MKIMDKLQDLIAELNYAFVERDLDEMESIKQEIDYYFEIIYTELEQNIFEDD